MGVPMNQTKQTKTDTVKYGHLKRNKKANKEARPPMNQTNSQQLYGTPTNGTKKKGGTNRRKLGPRDYFYSVSHRRQKERRQKEDRKKTEN